MSRNMNNFLHVSTTFTRRRRSSWAFEFIIPHLSALVLAEKTNKQHGSFIKIPVRRYVTIYQVKPRGMAKVVQWMFILPYVSKVPEISFLRLAVDVKICHLD